MGYDKAIIETDCQLVTSALSREEANSMEFGQLIQRCQQILSNRPLFRVEWVGDVGMRLLTSLLVDLSRLCHPFMGRHLLIGV
ncbi:hypothetical protein LINGRAHAP2_LOCUS14307 [Linum grandiflorum]